VQVKLDRAALAAPSDPPALVEGLSGLQLARRERTRVHFERSADEFDQLRERMRRLLEHDVARLAEHPVRDVARVELAQRHGQAHAHVLDAPALAGLHAR